jgi:hypothetical protein
MIAVGVCLPEVHVVNTSQNLELEIPLLQIYLAFAPRELFRDHIWKSDSQNIRQRKTEPFGICPVVADKDINILGRSHMTVVADGIAADNHEFNVMAHERQKASTLFGSDD